MPDNTNDPRWEGQDSLSLPDRPAHPDPSRRAEFSDPETAPTHGIYGFREAKHGQASEAQLDAERAQLAQARADALSGDVEVLRERASVDTDAGKDAKAALKHAEADLKHYQSQAKRRVEDDDSRPAGVRVAEAVQSGELVPSVEDASLVEGHGDGKRSDQLPTNAPVERKAS
jgi:hypothetical protein